jgi:hypothetical protein
MNPIKTNMPLRYDNILYGERPMGDKLFFIEYVDRVSNESFKEDFATELEMVTRIGSLVQVDVNKR